MRVIAQACLDKDQRIIARHLIDDNDETHIEIYSDSDQSAIMLSTDESLMLEALLELALRNKKFKYRG